MYIKRSLYKLTVYNFYLKQVPLSNTHYHKVGGPGTFHKTDIESLSYFRNDKYP